jgi:hypothetical protein
VIVNSRHAQRLQTLSEELGAPEKLVLVEDSFHPERAERTVSRAMDLVGGRVDHVIAHSAVRSVGVVARERGGLLSIDPLMYTETVSRLASLHYAAAHHLMPLLREDGSYVFVTGGDSADGTWNPLHTAWGERSAGGCSAVEQLNAHAMSALIAALGQELSDKGSKIRLGELRVGLKLNRQRRERMEEPRERPLSHDIGSICAGMAASAAPLGYSHVTTQSELDQLRCTFPAADCQYSVFYQPTW